MSLSTIRAEVPYCVVQALSCLVYGKFHTDHMDFARTLIWCHIYTNTHMDTMHTGTNRMVMEKNVWPKKLVMA